jgi:phage tail-like protein
MSQLLEHLPAIYQEPLDDSGPPGRYNFLSRYLLAFEQVLLGGGKTLSLEEEIAGIPTLLSAETTTEEFLPWLASWLALSLRAELSLPRKRRLLANIVALYRIRGTRIYLELLLKLFLEALPSVIDADLPALQIATHSTVGQDTYLGGGQAFLFQVTLAFSRRDQAWVEAQRRLAIQVIDIEKPAHAWYELKVIFPRFQISEQSTVGVDTLLAPPNLILNPRAQEMSHVD